MRLSFTLTGFDISNRFTGQILDEETDLYYYGTRYYDPFLAHFVQADSIVPNPGSSQALNRYSYCYNNPLKFNDPSGHEPSDDYWNDLPTVSDNTRLDSYSAFLGFKEGAMALSFYLNNGANALSSIYNGGMNAAVVSDSLETAINYKGELLLARPVTAGEVRDIFRTMDSIEFSKQKFNEFVADATELSTQILFACATDGFSTIEYIVAKFGTRALPYMAEDAMIMSGKYGASLLSETGSKVMSKQSLGQNNWIIKNQTPITEDLQVIGRLEDTAVAKNWPGHEVLDVKVWNRDINDAWIQDGINRRQTFYTASPLEVEFNTYIGQIYWARNNIWQGT